MKVKTRVILGLVKRDMAEALAVVIYPHEVELMSVVHGDGVFTEIEADKDDLHAAELLSQIYEIDVQEEYYRLERKYGRHPTQDITVVEYVFGRFNEAACARTFASSLGGVEVKDHGDEIRAKYATGEYTQKQLADEYGLHQSSISMIVRRAA